MSSMADTMVEQLLPHLDLRGFGEAMAKSQNMVFTAYGVVKRQDGGAGFFPHQPQQPLRPLPGRRPGPRPLSDQSPKAGSESLSMV